MKKIDIIGKNYFGAYTKTRTACRAVVVRNNELLLSYETLTDQWMLPGGGIESGETEEECCIRETAEETGVVVRPSECLLEIDEFYENERFVNRYFVCKAIGETVMNLTENEKKAGAEPRRMPYDEIKSIFAAHQSYADIDEMKRGIYFREYTALCELELQIDMKKESNKGKQK